MTVSLSKKITNIQAVDYITIAGVKAAKDDSTQTAEENQHQVGQEFGLGAGNGVSSSTGKPHKLLAQSNQHAGAMNPDGTPASVNEMSPEQKAEKALEAQQKAPDLTPNPQFLQQNTPTLDATPKGAPTPSMPGQS